MTTSDTCLTWNMSAPDRVCTSAGWETAHFLKTVFTYCSRK